MKKLFTLFSSLVLMAAFTAQANHVTVSGKSDFEAAFFQERTNEQCDTIFVKGQTNRISLSNGKYLPNNGTIHIIGVDEPESGEKAKLGLQWYLPLNTAGDHLSVFMENLVIECNGGNMANSKYLFSMKDTFFHYIDTLKFSNCEIRNYNRALFRVEPQAKKDGTRDGGDINYFGVENCVFHMGYLALNNPMALFRMDMRVSEMVFRNNLFYDLGYLNSLVQFSTMTEEAGRVDINFTFENNTFIGYCNSGSLMNFDSYVGQMSEFHINNNFFMAPAWKDDYNHLVISDSIAAANPDTLGRMPARYIASIQYGMVECLNNVVCCYKDPRNALDGDGEGTFLSSDINTLSMQDVEFDWTKFTDPQEGLYYIWKNEKVYTAGVNGAPIGDINLYTETKQSVARVTVKVEGSESADIMLNTEVGKELSGKFISGEEITVTAIPKGKLNKFLGWSNGSTELTQTIILEDNMELVARFQEADYLAVWNFEQLTTNNVKLSAPLVSNYQKGDAPYTLCYATWDGSQYVDSTTNALMTRNNKVANDARNCVIIHSDSAAFASKEHSDYIYFEVPSVEEGSFLTFNAATDNICLDAVVADYSTDMVNWTNFARRQIDTFDLWLPVRAEIPASLKDQTVYIRIKGDGDFYYRTGLTEVNRKYEFLFISEIILFGPGEKTAIQTEKAVEADDTVYDILGRRVPVSENLKPGLYIQGGRKFVVR